jgi:hypothetical protein
LGIHPPLWNDLMSKALQGLTVQHEELRRALPVGYLRDPTARASLEAGFAEVMALLSREGSATDGAGMLHDEFIRLSRGVPDGGFVRDLDRLSAIGLDTRLTRRPHLICRLLFDEDTAALQFSRSLLRGSPKYREAMTFVTQRDGPFSVSDLPGLDDDGRIGFVQELVREGLLTFAD